MKICICCYFFSALHQCAATKASTIKSVSRSNSASDGTGRFNDQNYKYSAWGDGTGWWDHHGNPSSPDPDFDNAYIFGNEAPYFPVRSDRVYLACIWGFGSSDAGGGYFGNAVSASDLNAAARFVVIGEQ